MTTDTTKYQHEIDNLIAQGAAALATRNQLDEQAAEEAAAARAADLAAEWAPTLAAIRAAVPPWIEVEQPNAPPRTREYREDYMYRGVPIRLAGCAPIFAYVWQGAVRFTVPMAQLSHDDDDNEYRVCYWGADLLGDYNIPTETDLAVAVNEAAYQAQQYALKRQEAKARNEAGLARHIAEKEAEEAAAKADDYARADRNARRTARFYREENNAVTLTRIADALEKIVASMECTEGDEMTVAHWKAQYEEMSAAYDLACNALKGSEYK